MKPNIYLSFLNGVLTANIKYLRPGTITQIALVKFNWDNVNKKWVIYNFEMEDGALEDGAKMINKLKSAIERDKAVLEVIKNSNVFTELLSILF